MEKRLQDVKNRCTVHVYVTPALRQKLIELALLHHRSMSAEVQTLIDAEYHRIFGDMDTTPPEILGES